MQSVAVGFIHGYRMSGHEQQALNILRKLAPQLTVTLASEVCPEIREYERLTTATANAYVQPLMTSYLNRLGNELETLGLGCPLLLMTSGGWFDHAGDGSAIPDSSGRVGSGGRRDPGRSRGRAEWSERGSVLRHGWHHGKNLSAGERAGSNRPGI